MNSTIANRPCVRCGDEVIGRRDRLFCSVSCKSAYHYERNKEKEATFYSFVDIQLKRNHRLLKHFNTAGKATVREEHLTRAGFDPSFFTHFWRTKDNRTYFFCYDMGHFKKTENGRSKYVLVHWQDYMSPSVPKSKTDR